MAVTDSNGRLTSQQRYLPFGQVRDDLNGPRITQTDLSFTGQRANSYIKLDDYRARWLDPELGRFTQPDDIVPDPTNPQSLNRYSYVFDQPVILSDPSGHFPIFLVAVLLIGAALLTGDTPKASPPPPADGNATDFWGLVSLGREHAAHANITGQLLQSLENDPRTMQGQDEILQTLRGDPRYGKEEYDPKNQTVPVELGDHGGMIPSAFSGDQNFWAVKNATLSATNTKVSANGTITTTWNIHDSFDFEPDWSGQTRQGWNYWQYNLLAQFVGVPLYHKLLGGAEKLPDDATWTKVYPNEDSSCRRCE